MKILVVEQNPRILDAIVHSLKSHNHEVTGQKNMDLPSENSGAFDFLIADLKSAGVISGLQEGLNGLQARGKIGLYEPAELEILAKAVTAGFQVLFAKPFSPQIMHETINNWGQNTHIDEVQQESWLLRVILEAVVDTLSTAMETTFVSGKPFVLKGQEPLGCQVSSMVEISGNRSIAAVQISLKKDCFIDVFAEKNIANYQPTSNQSRFESICADIHARVLVGLETAGKLVEKPTLGVWQACKWPEKSRLVVPFGFNSNQVAFVEFFLKYLAN